MAEITETGVTGKTLVQYRDEITGEYYNVDPAWNVLPESPDGQVIAIWSEAIANLDEQVQYAYMSRDPSTAIGQALEDIADYAGIRRLDATPSTATVTVSGTNGTIIPAGKRVRQWITGTLWALDSEVTIAGPTDVNVTAVEAGALSAPQGTLTEIADPVAGWQSVTNSDAAALGRNVESDTQLRQRRDLSVALPSQNQVDSIFAAVSNVDGVTQARVYENPEGTTDSRGLLRNSVAVFVQGGEVEDIQSEIVKRKNPGSGMNKDAGFPNAVTQDVETELGNIVPTTFFRPVLVTVYVEITINTTRMPETDKDRIADAVEEYASEGYTGSGAGFTQRGFRIGETVASGRLYTPVNRIVGDRGFVESIYVGETDPPGAQTVSIEFNDLGVFDAENITVVYV